MENGAGGEVPLVLLPSKFLAHPAPLPGLRALIWLKQESKISSNQMRLAEEVLHQVARIWNNSKLGLTHLYLAIHPPTQTFIQSLSKYLISTYSVLGIKRGQRSPPHSSSPSPHDSHPLS